MSSSNAASNVIPMRDLDRPVPQQAVQFDRLLQECRQLATGRLADSIAGMLDKSDGTLQELASAAADRDTRELYAKARDTILSQGRTIQTQFLEHYAAEFDRRARRDARASEQFSQYDLSSLELGLVEDSDLEETLKTNDMAAKLRRYCEEELGALDQRVGVLVGDANLQADSNPFSPQAICVAYQHTCRELEPDLKVRMVLQRMFDDHVLDAVRSIYKDLNSLLVQRGILPKIRYGTARRNAAEGAAAAAQSAAGEPAEAARAAGGAAGSGGDLFGMLQSLLAVNAGALLGAHGAALPQGVPAAQPAANALQIPGFAPIAVGAAAPAMLQGPALLASLTRIQHGDVSAVAGGGLPLASTVVMPGTANLLRELKQTNVGSGMSQMDAITLDIVAMLFDEIFEDDKIPAAMKGLIGRLQIPTLKVAILDKTFFSRRDHPARTLLDALGEIGLGLPAEFDHESPLYQRLESVLQKLIDGFSDEIGIFDELRAELEAVIAEQNRLAEEEAARLAKSIEQKERLALAKAAAQDEIRQRVRTTKLPRSVVKFLTEQWLKLLLVAHAKNGPESELWKTAVSTMDLLIWSVNPSKTLDERRQLAAKLPGLLKRLNAGMQLIRTDDAVRKQFFVKLMRCHTQIINGPAPRRPGVEPAAGTAAAAVAPDPAGAKAKAQAPTPARHDTAPPPQLRAPAAAQLRAPVAPQSNVPIGPQPNSPRAAQPKAPGTSPSDKAPLAQQENTPSPQRASMPPAQPSNPSAPREEPASMPTAAARADPVSAPHPACATDAATKPPAAVGAAAAADEDDASLDFTETANPQFCALVIQNPFGDGQIEVEEIDLSELPGHAGGNATAAGAGQGDEFQRLAAGMREDTWVEFRGERDKWVSARLCFISPVKGTYLFVDRQGRRTGEYSPHQLARELRSGRAAVLDNVPLFDRAMTSLVGVLKSSPAKH
jgi:hypothetical protein